jgi:DNA-binding NarL/FixJ family response regulator
VPLDPDLDGLTRREREVLRLIARGYTYQEAAARLHISTRTVETHVSAMLRKLQLSNHREPSRWAPPATWPDRAPHPWSPCHMRSLR